MKTKKKALTLALCAVLLVGATFLGTLAYLTDQESVTNTFTVGQVHIDLDETNVDPKEGNMEDRDKANAYHILPGHEYVKDPTVTVLEDSEDCYVRMLVKVSSMENLKKAFPADKFPTYYAGNGLFLLQKLCKNWNAAVWECVGYDSESATYEFRYTAVVPKDESKDTVLPALFTHVVIPGELTNDQIINLEDFSLNVTAHAIQADGFSTADQAWQNF